MSIQYYLHIVEVILLLLPYTPLLLELMYGVSIYYRIPATQVSHTEEDDTLITRGYLQVVIG